MKIVLTLSSFYVDKPEVREIEFDENADAVQLPNGDILKVNQLVGDALHQYIFEKYVEGTPMEQRIIDMKIVK